MRHDTVVKRRANFAITTVLAFYCISSGALTLVFAIACLATFVRLTHTLIYLLFFFILVRLYPCAFMAVLNSRGTIISFFHGTSTLSHVESSDVTSAGAGASASIADAIGPQFATQSAISGISRTKVSTLRFAESELRGLSGVDGAKAEHERFEMDPAVNP
ncbi:hypothetical protein EDB92DRAFT_1865784 [Lactarius akahatsu]|uniref:DUF6534 domain-containing protein n=1 Tax=Lactarius akahatsu TaxID=416441 RepID=A0AAD4LG06_9AGAM|nr:hypothetical protein EDB92DRAFT_1865784 [Lactarius akahatsu]